MEYLNVNNSINTTSYPEGAYDWMRILAGAEGSIIKGLKMTGNIDLNGFQIIGGSSTNVPDGVAEDDMLFWKLLPAPHWDTKSGILGHLKDVNINAVINDQVLKYNSTTQKWENKDDISMSPNGSYTITGNWNFNGTFSALNASNNMNLTTTNGRQINLSSNGLTSIYANSYLNMAGGFGINLTSPGGGDVFNQLGTGKYKVNVGGGGLNVLEIDTYSIKTKIADYESHMDDDTLTTKLYVDSRSSVQRLQTYALTSTHSATQRRLSSSNALASNSGQVVFINGSGLPTLDLMTAEKVRINKKTADSQPDFSIIFTSIGTKFAVVKKLIQGDTDNAFFNFNINSNVLNGGLYLEYDITAKYIWPDSVFTDGMEIVLDKPVPSTLKELTDTNIISPTNGQALRWVSEPLLPSGGHWEPSDLSFPTAYADLTDVIVPKSILGVNEQPIGTLNHYNGSSYVVLPEINVNPTTKNIVVNTAGNISMEAQSGDMVFTSDARDIISQAGRDVTLTADRNVIVTATNQITLNAPDGTIINSPYCIIRPSAIAGSYALISESNKSAEQYSLDIATFNNAIPNKIYVDNRVTAYAGDKYTTTSTTSMTIALGSQSFSTVDLNLAYSIGQTVIIANDVTHSMIADVVSYNPVTGAMVVNVTLITGLGTFASWDVSLNGAPGPAGTSATIFVGSTTTLTPGSSATVSNSGTSSSAIFNFGVPAGVAGINGTSATIVVGTVSALAPGTTPTVINSGTSSSAIFDFGLTTGATGATGPPGAGGLSANAFEYKINTTVGPTPASGDVRYNNASQVASTILYFSHIDFLGNDIEVILSIFPTGTQIIIQDKNVTANVQKWVSTGMPTVVAGSYVSFPVSLSSSSGTGTSGFTNNMASLAFFLSTGYTGTVTSVSALTIGTSGSDLSSTVANATTTPVITLQVPTASATNRGALSSADWSLFDSKQGALTLTTTGSSGASTLVGTTLNIPQYSGGGGGSGSMILANPYPLCKIGANITPATTQYYFNATALSTATATGIRFMLGINGSDDIRFALYRSNVDWAIATSTLIGMSAVINGTGLTGDRVATATLTAESGQNLDLTAGEGIILACYSDGTTSYWKGSTITSSTQAWQNTTNLPAGLIFPTNPATKATNSGTVPMLELI